MISSMTGYGRAETSINGAKVTVEISSVNNRFCEIQCRLPKFATDLEPKVKELILSQISRGKIYYALNWEETSVANLVKLNEEAAEIYFKIIKELKEKYKLKGSVEVEDILTLPNLIKFEREEIDPEKVWGLISEATLKALTQLKQMRQKEDISRRTFMRLPTIRTALPKALGFLTWLSSLRSPRPAARKKSSAS